MIFRESSIKEFWKIADSSDHRTSEFELQTYCMQKQLPSPTVKANVGHNKLISLFLHGIGL